MSDRGSSRLGRSAAGGSAGQQHLRHGHSSLTAVADAAASEQLQHRLGPQSSPAATHRSTSSHWGTTETESRAPPERKAAPSSRRSTAGRQHARVGPHCSPTIPNRAQYSTPSCRGGNHLSASPIVGGSADTFIPSQWSQESKSIPAATVQSPSQCSGSPQIRQSATSDESAVRTAGFETQLLRSRLLTAGKSVHAAHRRARTPRSAVDASGSCDRPRRLRRHEDHQTAVAPTVGTIPADSAAIEHPAQSMSKNSTDHHCETAMRGHFGPEGRLQSFPESHSSVARSAGRRLLDLQQRGDDRAAQTPAVMRSSRSRADPWKSSAATPHGQRSARPAVPTRMA
eukprot:SAG31_NODE_8471_length_1445_cov_1.028975_1_plen_341_part_10